MKVSNAFKNKKVIKALGSGAGGPAFKFWPFLDVMANFLQCQLQWLDVAWGKPPVSVHFGHLLSIVDGKKYKSLVTLIYNV